MHAPSLMRAPLGACCALAVSASIHFAASPVELRAAVVVQGDVALPTSESIVAIIGETGIGSVALDDGSEIHWDQLHSGKGFFGNGTLSASGIGTKATIRHSQVGFSGVGALRIADGASLRTDYVNLGFSRGGLGVVEVSGPGTSWGGIAEEGAIIHVGAFQGQGEVVVWDRARVHASNLVVGGLGPAQPAGRGKATIADPGTLWRTTGATSVGDGGMGELEVLRGGYYAAEGGLTVGMTAIGRGTLIVSGENSLVTSRAPVTVGSAGSGMLRVLDGASFLNGSSPPRTISAASLDPTAVLILSAGIGSESVVEIAGGGSQLWNAGALVARSAATIHVHDGGSLVAGSITMGDSSSGTTPTVKSLLVDGFESKIRSYQGIRLGFTEPVETIVSDGAVLESINGSISLGRFARTKLLNAQLGGNGTGNISNSGYLEANGLVMQWLRNEVGGTTVVSAGSRLDLPGGIVNLGTLIVDGGALTTPFIIPGTLGSTGGTARFRDATIRSSHDLGRLDVPRDGRLELVGGRVVLDIPVNNLHLGEVDLLDDVHAEFQQGLHTQGRITLRTGTKASVYQDFTQTSYGTFQTAILGHAIEPPTPLLEATGKATLGGELIAYFADSYRGSAGDAFPLVAAADGVFGRFNRTTLPALSEGLAWQVDYQSHSVALRIVGSASGDFNGDGSVNGADLAVWQTEYGNQQGATAGGDFLAWQRNHAATAGAVNTAVPEPAAVVLVLLAAGAVPRRRAIARLAAGSR